MSGTVIIICGPTASGKTELSIALAKRLSTEIISADSMNVYRGLDIGTAKPTKAERTEVTHHMIDVVSPFDEFSVDDYKKGARNAADILIKQGKIPVICGGTGFYINSVLYNLSYGNGGKNTEIREKYLNIYRESGAEAVFSVLQSVDPESAELLHPNDLKRVIRALEIYETSGVKKSDIKDDLTPEYNFFAYSTDYPRNLLYSRINARVDKMIDAGLIEEVDGLIKCGVTINHQCMQGIGYKETAEFIVNGGNIRQLTDDIKLNTRHYAKRQQTFFKRMKVRYLPFGDVDKNVETIINDIL